MKKYSLVFLLTAISLFSHQYPLLAKDYPSEQSKDNNMPILGTRLNKKEILDAYGRLSKIDNDRTPDDLFISKFIDLVCNYDPIADEQPKKWREKLSDFIDHSPETGAAFYKLRNIYFSKYNFRYVNDKKANDFLADAANRNLIDPIKWAYFSKNIDLIQNNLYKNIAVFSSGNSRKLDKLTKTVAYINLSTCEEDGGYWGYAAFLISEGKTKELTWFSKSNKETEFMFKSIYSALEADKKLRDILSGLYKKMWANKHGLVGYGFRSGDKSEYENEKKSRDLSLCAFYSQTAEQAKYYLDLSENELRRQIPEVTSAKKFDKSYWWISTAGLSRIVASKWNLSSLLEKIDSDISTLEKGLGEDIHIQRISSQIKGCSPADLPNTIPLDTIIDVDSKIWVISPFDGSKVPYGKTPIPPENWKIIHIHN